VQYRGVQWRFHPHACPEVPRERPHGYAAVAASSWIRDNIKPREPNSQGLVLDFVENDDLGDRSFKSRMFDPADVSTLSNLTIAAPITRSTYPRQISTLVIKLGTRSVAVSVAKCLV
jgi:hypothetical protein